MKNTSQMFLFKWSSSSKVAPFSPSRSVYLLIYFITDLDTTIIQIVNETVYYLCDYAFEESMPLMHIF